MKKMMIVLINFYQNFLSFDKGVLAVFAPGGACRYNPSCSEYARQMIVKFGAVEGIKMGIKRIWTCK